MDYSTILDKSVDEETSINLNSNDFMRMFNSLFNENQLVLYFLIVNLMKYVIPVLTLLGVIGNTLSMIVLASKHLKNVFYSYFLVLSVASFLYILISFVYYLLKYSFLASLLDHLYSTHSYAFVFFELYVYFLLTNVLNVFVNVLFIVLALRRLLILVSQSLRQSSHTKLWLSLVLLITLLLNVLNFFAHSIQELDCERLEGVRSLDAQHEHVKSKSCFSINTKDVPDNKLFQLLALIAFIIRGVILPFMILIINIVIVYKFRKHINKKVKLKQNLIERSSSTLSNYQKLMLESQNITRITVTISFLYTFTFFLHTLTSLLYFWYYKYPKLFLLIYVISTFFIVLVYSLNVIIFSLSDKLFAKTLKTIIFKPVVSHRLSFQNKKQSRSETTNNKKSILLNDKYIRSSDSSKENQIRANKVVDR